MGVALLSDYLQSVAGSALIYPLFFAVLLAFELAMPRGAVGVSALDRARGLMFWAILIPFDLAVVCALHAGRSAIGFEPIFTYRSQFGSAVAAALAAAVWTDFTFYWFHRFQHRFLWRWHSVHHSIRNMSAINSYHHWSEPLWHALVVGIPLSFVSIESLNAAAWTALLLRAWPYYIHTPTRLNVGPLRWLLVDNRYHRIHHSSDPAHFDRNFGALTPLWDWAWGTMYMPEKNEWHCVGIEERGEPTSLQDWTALPSSRSSSISNGELKVL